MRILKIGEIRQRLEKAGGPFIGPRGGKWADSAHTIAWTEDRDSFRAVSREEAVRTVRKLIREGDHAGWLRNADRAYKPRIAQAIAGSAELRNATLNLFHQQHQLSTGKKSSFPDFLSTPVTLYRAGKTSGDEHFSSFSYDPAMAQKFADKYGEKVETVSVLPKNTYGMINEMAEGEVLVPLPGAASGKFAHGTTVEVKGKTYTVTARTGKQVTLRGPDGKTLDPLHEDRLAELAKAQHLTITLRKAGPFMGPRGGLWADAAHTIAWKPDYANDKRNLARIEAFARMHENNKGKPDQRYRVSVLRENGVIVHPDVEGAEPEPPPPKLTPRLFHSTPSSMMAGIAKHGLRPRKGQGTFNHGGYDHHSQGKVFLSDSHYAAQSWHSKVDTMAEYNHGDKRGSDPAVMLRVTKQVPTEVDPVGNKDVDGSRMTSEKIAPEHLEFWHPEKKAWAPVSEWHRGLRKHDADALAPEEEEDAHGVEKSRDPQHDLPLNSDGTVTLFHGTSSEAAKLIHAESRLRSAGEPHVYLTTDRTNATGYGDAVVAVRVDPKLLSLDDEFPNGRKDFSLSVGKPGGSIAVKTEKSQRLTISLRKAKGDQKADHKYKSRKPDGKGGWLYEYDDDVTPKASFAAWHLQAAVRHALATHGNVETSKKLLAENATKDTKEGLATWKKEASHVLSKKEIKEAKKRIASAVTDEDAIAIAKDYEFHLPTGLGDVFRGERPEGAYRAEEYDRLHEELHSKEAVRDTATREPATTDLAAIAKAHGLGKVRINEELPEELRTHLAGLVSNAFDDLAAALGSTKLSHGSLAIAVTGGESIYTHGYDYGARYRHPKRGYGDEARNWDQSWYVDGKERDMPPTIEIDTHNVDALAHEFGHAVDEACNLFRPEGLSLDATESIRMTQRDVMFAVEDSKMADRARAHPKRDYWANKPELFARTFEQYVATKLRKQGRANSLLTRHTYDDKVHGGMFADQATFERDIEPLMDTFMTVVKGASVLHKAFRYVIGVPPDLSKAFGEQRAGHKYLRRKPDGRGGWLYEYDEPSARRGHAQQRESMRNRYTHGTTPVSPTARAARVGIPGDVVLPPPGIPKLPNLTGDERAMESKFAAAFEADPNKATADFYGIAAKNSYVFETDGAKALLADWKRDDLPPDERGAPMRLERATVRSTYNTALHQTANAIAKRAFVVRLNEIAKMPPEQRKILVTSGGCAAGKGVGLAARPDLPASVAATWDAAGEQNATENEWLIKECAKRGIKPTFMFVHSDPKRAWPGAVKRAEGAGRMVDARVFADSYAEGAKNFAAFHDKYKDHADFVFAEVRFGEDGKPNVTLGDGMPEGAKKLSADAIYHDSMAYIENEKSEGRVAPHIYRGATAGRRIWGN